MFKNPLRTASLAGLGLAAGSSFADGTFDVTTYVAQVAASTPGILLIGGAVFAVLVAIKSTKWARRAL